MKHLILISLVLAVTACGQSSETAVTAPKNAQVKLNIISGNNQLVAAASTNLPVAVVAQVVTVPDASPVAGAVVCSVAIDTVHKLTPSTPCRATDASGEVSLQFAPGTTAGQASAEIQATFGSDPEVFDTAFATVTPDTLSLRATLSSGPIGAGAYSTTTSGATHTTITYSGLLHVGTTLTAQDLVKSVQDKYGNTLTSYKLGWSISTITSQALTATDDSTIAGKYRIDPYVDQTAWPVPLRSPQSTQATVSGFTPGIEWLSLYANGKIIGADVVAVLP